MAASLSAEDQRIQARLVDVYGLAFMVPKGWCEIRTDSQRHSLGLQKRFERPPVLGIHMVQGASHLQILQVNRQKAFAGNHGASGSSAKRQTSTTCPSSDSSILSKGRTTAAHASEERGLREGCASAPHGTPWLAWGGRLWLWLSLWRARHQQRAPKKTTPRVLRPSRCGSSQQPGQRLTSAPCRALRFCSAEAQTGAPRGRATNTKYVARGLWTLSANLCSDTAADRIHRLEARHSKLAAQTARLRAKIDSVVGRLSCMNRLPALDAALRFSLSR